MMKQSPILLVFLAVVASCNVFKKSGDSVSKNTRVIMLDTVVKCADSKNYQASATRINDIIHTKLDVHFDWDKTQLLGKATITAKPYFLPVDKIDLDARGMDIHEVDLIKGDSLKTKLSYTYENNILSVKLDRQYKRDEAYKLFIDYTSKPNELKAGGSEAITNDKGLYFINPDGKDKNKPKQIWTQGETQASSCWFPTIDHPNEKMTHEIYITVNKKYTTLSNGELVFSTDNNDSTRTDYWKMELPHSPYLVMMAIGEYAIVKDTWRDKEVNYYVEKDYEPHAKARFGNTPEMMEFFSEKLGVAYPWNKYSQVIVRDYVSGAMENTTATIHGEFVQKTDRELLDRDYDDIISHELFHQWFGDLVTCESWSNTPLNESFATYGEYLWFEHKYGRDAADRHIQVALTGYLADAMVKQVNLIRFNYGDQEEMFDTHSYNKGGRVLHMLRKYVGDDAFFAALKLYLETNKFGSVEIHNLRLAFEQVTGEDLNWFFNQWFLASGHPKLLIRASYDEVAKKETVSIKQMQNAQQTPIYKLPIAIDIYYNGKKERHNITIMNTKEDFVFELPVKPDLVNVDAEKILLCEKDEQKGDKEWVFQYYHAPLYMDRYEGLANVINFPTDSLTADVILSGLNDRYWYLRAYTIKNGLKKILTSKEKLIKEKLINIIQNDQEAGVRSAAIKFLAANYKDEDLFAVYEGALNDKSYSVLSEALRAISKLNKSEGLALAKAYEKEKNDGVLYTVAEIYSREGNDSNNDFFINYAQKIDNYEYIGFANVYADFLKNASDSIVDKGLPVLEKIANENEKFVSFYGQKSIKDLADNYIEKKKNINSKIQSLKSANPNDPEIKKLEQELEKSKIQEKKIRDVYNAFKKEEDAAGKKNN